MQSVCAFVQVWFCGWFPLSFVLLVIMTVVLLYCSSFLDETRAIKAAQDEAYEESLAIDHAKVFVVCDVYHYNYNNVFI